MSLYDRILSESDSVVSLRRVKGGGFEGTINGMSVKITKNRTRFWNDRANFGRGGYSFEPSWDGWLLDIGGAYGSAHKKVTEGHRLARDAIAALVSYTGGMK